MKKSSISTILLSLSALCFLMVLVFYLYFIWRYDALPWEKQIAKNIEQAVYGAQYKNSNHDYCALPYNPEMPPPCPPFADTNPSTGMICTYYEPTCEWGHVTYLYLARAGLQIVPIEEIAKLPGLTKLDLSGNQLASLPVEIGELNNLEQLELSGNQLTNLPPEIGQLHNLKYFGLLRNRLKSLPAEIGELNNLVHLDLSGNQFYSLQPEIGQLRNLTYLDLSNNQLRGLPPEIGELSNLEDLDLSGNHLTSFPQEIEQLRNLKALNLSNNQFYSLPPEIGQLHNLKYLNLDHNSLSGPLPKFLTNLPLEQFKFSKTDFCVPVDEDIQEWLGSISPNYSLYLPSDLCSLTAEDQSVMLALYEIPGHPADWSPQISPCTWSGVNCDLNGHIITLYLLGAKLTKLPPEIGQLSHLQDLRLPYNRLTELPPEIGQLRNLTYLDLSNNQIAGLPPEIGQLTNLKTLDLPSNQLIELPSEISRLTKLEFLNVDSNPLHGPLPIFLTKLQHVQFWFHDTDLCVPNDGIILDWLRRQSTGFYNAEGGEFIYVPADPEADIRWYLEHQGCE